MKVFVVLLAVIGTALSARLHGSVDKTPNGLAALLAEKGGLRIGEVGTRIVGGEITPITDVPYIASLQTGGQLVQVDDYVNHPHYNEQTLDNDITVIHLLSPLSLGPGVAIINLPAHRSAVPVGTPARVSGWGATREGGFGSALLQAVNVPYVSNAQCNDFYRGGITDGMLCAGFPEGGRDACQGDSGGPLSAHNQVIGIVSWGEGCAQPNFPGVYARVEYYVPWINSKITFSGSS